MKIKKCFNGLLTITLILSILFAMPIFASDTEGNKKIVLEYNDIEKRVLEENLQLKASKISVDKLESKDDDADEDIDEAEDALGAQIYGMQLLINDMDAIINKYDPDSLTPTVDPDVVKIANATKNILNGTLNSLKSQIDSLEDSTDGISDQLKAAKLNLEQAEDTLVNSAQNMFVLYHQLTNNIDQLDITRDQLSDQLNAVKKNVELGLATQTAAIDLETSLLEFEASYTALVHQHDSLLLQMKGLLGLTYKDGLTLGELPPADRSFIDSVEFDKDIEIAVENAMSIKIKDVELSNSSIKGNRKKYELQMQENETALTFTKKYYTLIETRDNLLVSESKLNAAKLKLEQGQSSYNKGLISQTELRALENEVKSQELTGQSNLDSLFCEIENYKAMKTGLL